MPEAWQVTELLHKTLKAKVVATDRGEFTAIAAAYSRDRAGDEIVPGAFEKTIKAWQETGRNLPLHWDHESSPESIIGLINPMKMAETEDGLYVEGRLDLGESEVAQEAWRSMKANALALSFGYLTVKSRKEGKTTKLLELDLFEVSIVPAPMNNDTRFLSLKSVATLPAWVDRLKDLPEMDDEAVKQFIEDAGQITEYIAAERADERSLRSQSNELALAAALGWSEEQAKASGISEEVLKRNRDILTFADERQELDVLSVLKTVADLDLDLVKTIWTTAYINDLPDPAFLYIEPGEKGSLRHFPYKDADGVVDLPRLRNALARIPQANLPQDVEDRLTAKATRLLENAEKALSSVTDNPKGQKSDDLLRKRTFDFALEMSGGKDVRLTEPVPDPQPEPLDEVALRRKSDELALEVARG